MAYNNLSAAFLDRGDVEQGVALLRTARKAPWQPSDLNGRVLVLSNLERRLEEQGHAAEAIDLFAEMARLAPLSARGRDDSGRLLLEKGDAAAAAAQFAEALRLDPGDEEARAGLEQAAARAR